MHTIKYILLLLVSLVMLTSPAYAGAIKHIKINGNQRVESQTVISHLTLREGSTSTDSEIDASLKRLYKTGLFSNVRITNKKGTLTVTVKENPIINKIVFEGNKRVKDEDIQKEIKLAPRSVYNRSKVRNDLTRIISIYQKSGRFSVKAEPKIIQLDQNRINLIFEIDEGKKATIQKVTFIGNRAFTDTKLAKVIQSKRSRWYRFFSDDDNYNPDRLLFDQELLRKFFIAHGYADFKVSSAIAEISPEKDAFYLTFTLNEGVKYNFGKIAINTKLKKLNKEHIQSLTKTTENQVFNAEKVERSVETIVDYLSDEGYAFVDVDPVFNRKPKQRLIDISYRIKEGPKVYIERINITGNVRTLDKVIRREFRLSEGDPFNAAQIRRSQQRIRNLGFFDSVNVDTKRGSSKDKAHVNVEIAERSTGEINFGAGFSTTDGALMNASIRERNLLGKGQDLRFHVQRATKGLQLDTSFTEPYFMDKNIAVGFDLFKITRDRESESSYDSDATGITLRTTYAITEHLNHTVRYSYRTDDITDISTGASRFIQDQAGQNTTSLVGHSLMFDNRDNRFDPTTGYSVRFNQDFAGLGGDSEYIRHEFRGDYFKPVYRDDFILRLTGKAGYIFGTGDSDIRINERFFLGGSDLRGFRSAGVGPRDITSNDALGGNLYYTASTELMFPLGLPEELGVRGAFFVDTGSLSQLDDSGSEIRDEPSIRASAGIGISWGSPLGPIRIDLASPFIKEEFDRTQQVRFSFGTRF